MRHTDPPPTANTTRPDLSPGPSRASAAGRYDEFSGWSDDGEDGYVWRTQACVCGGAISVPWPCPDRVLTAAQLVHNGSLLHSTWRHRRAL
jgi:hypothetical protein